ncbi:MAG: HAD-IA family hydrolase [Lachnospiraceae bacterium]
MKKISGWFDLLISIILTIMFYICGWIMLPTIYSFEPNEEINNFILRFLVKQYAQNVVEYIIIAAIIGMVISYIIFKLIVKIVSDRTGNIFDKHGIQIKYDKFLNDACELYILGGDIDFLLKCNTQLEKIESLGEKCKILCKQYENHINKNELKKIYKRLYDNKVNIRRYDQESDKFHNLRGQIKRCKDGTYECLLVEKMDKKGKFKVLNLENQFVINKLIESFESIYNTARNPLISAVLFDMGGVYFDGDFTNDFLKVINSKLSQNIQASWNQKLVLDDKLNLGEKTINQWVEDNIKRELTYNERQDIEELWKNIWKPNPLMKELVENLKEHRYEVGVLSNMDAINGGNYNEKGYLNVFPPKNRFLSYDCKLLKPDKEFYKLVCDKMNFEPYEILFIDDHEKNVNTASDYGIHAIQFSLNDDKEILNLKNELRKLHINFE